MLAAAFLSGSCSKYNKQPESFVGATKLPSVEALSRETIYITRGANDWGGDRLAYELRPDGSLTITHTYLSFKTPKEEVRARDVFRLQPAVATRFRRLISRVRPNSLDGQGLEKAEVRPLGCERKGPHDFGEVGVAFISEGDAKTARVALFELPQPDSCATGAAKHARETVWAALRLLPASKAVEGFEHAS